MRRRQDPSEECDDGNQHDGDECTNACTAAKCGDNVVLLGIEECDDGNQIDTDACPSLCKSAVCGDTFLHERIEDCDDGNIVDNDICSNTCKDNPKRVFVTSQMYTGNLGGLAGADQKCQQLAVSAGLLGTYMAWLSDDTGSPSTRMNKANIPYVLVNGTKVANNWDDLIDGDLLAALNLTETGGAVPAGNTKCGGDGAKTVWSNTDIHGNLFSHIDSCTNWTSTNGQSHWGGADQIGPYWTEWCNGTPGCDRLSPIYCVQQ